MFEQLNFDSNGVKTLCEIGKLHPEMMMTIRVKKFKENEEITVSSDSLETAFLILQGEAEISWCGKTEKIFREKIGRAHV